MNKYLKYSLITLGGLIGTTLLVAVGVVTLVNPNQFKTLITKSVYKSTGRNISLNGDISWKLYPNIGLTLRDVTISNPIDKPEFPESNFLTLKSADVAVALIPLIDRNIELKTLNIDGLNIALVQKNNINNWTFTQPESSIATGEQQQAKPIKFEMSGLSLTNSNIKYDNYDTNQHINLPNTNLTIATGYGGHILLDQQQQLLDLHKVSINYNDNFVGELNVKLNNFESPVFDSNINLTTFKANTILNQLHIADKQRSGLKLIDNIKISGGATGDVNNLSLKDFAFNLSDTIKGKLSIDVKNIKNPTYTGNLELEPFNLNSALDQLNIAVKERKDKPLLNTFAISSDGFSGDSKNLAINKFSLALGSQFTILLNNLKVVNFTNPNISGSINIPQTNLNSVLDGLNIAKAQRQGKTLLNKFAASTSAFSATPNSVSLTNFKLTLGDSFSPSFSKLNIDNFLNPVVSGHIHVPNFSANSVMTQLGLAVPDIHNKAILKNVALDSNFNATTNSIKLANLNATVDKTTATGSMDVTSIKPLSFTNNITLNQLEVSDFSDINGYKVPMKQLHFAGNVKMNDKMEIASLTGKQSISVGNITVQGLNTNALVMELNSTINNAGKGNKDILTTAINATQTLNAVNQMKAQVQAAIKPGNRNYSQTTNLGAFSANANFTNGLINPSNVSLTGGGIADVTGNGSANLAGNKKIAYNVNSKITIKGINPVFDKLTFPATITGTIENPSASLGWTSIEQQLAKYLFEQNKAQVQNVVKQQINNAVGQQINKAIGQQNGEQATDAVSKGVTNAIGKLFGG